MYRLKRYSLATSFLMHFLFHSLYNSTRRSEGFGRPVLHNDETKSIISVSRLTKHDIAKPRVTSNWIIKWLPRGCTVHSVVVFVWYLKNVRQLLWTSRSIGSLTTVHCQYHSSIMAERVTRDSDESFLMSFKVSKEIYSLVSCQE